MRDHDSLLATCWSSAGDAASDRADLRSPVPLRERVEAAAAAGFTGFGLLSADLPAAEAAYGLSEVRTMLADNGITDLELEGIPNWWDGHAGPAGPTGVREAVLRAAEALGARHIKVTPDGDNGPWEPAQWAAALGELARQSADVGARLGLEFFPWANVATLGAGLRLVEDCGHPAAGVVIDVWHIARAGTPLSELAAVPLDRIVGVELNDAQQRVIGTLYEDTVHRRRFCGEGDFDLPGMITALRATGWNGPWGVEILSDDYRGMPLAQALARAAETARAALDAAG